MPNLNRVMLMGNLTREPELRYTPSGTAVCAFGIAINRKWTAKDGTKKEETCFVDCEAWARTGEVIAEHMHKGKPIFVEGRLKLDQWEAQDGTKRSKLKVTVEQFQFLGSGKQDREGPPTRPPVEKAPPAGASPSGDGGFDVGSTEDIPF